MEAQVEYLAGLQGLSAPQMLQFILNSLEGEARREVQAAPEATRATAQAVFDFLTGQYGDATPVAVLRTQFFNCKQGPRQTLRAFALRLREQFTRLKRRRDHGLGGEETLLRDQFLLGLREGPVRQSLRVQLRRDPELTFEDLRREALALELDHAETADPSVCMAASGTSSSTSSVRLEADLMCRTHEGCPGTNDRAVQDTFGGVSPGAAKSVALASRTLLLGREPKPRKTPIPACRP